MSITLKTQWSSGIIRNIVGQPKSTLDLRDIMDNQKILIMDLSKGRVGEDNSALLGAMLVTKIQLAAMSRTDIPEKERKDFYLYVDEFQNFATDSFATILSEARKYRLNLIVGHQYIGQLVQERNTKVRDAIFGNVGTLVVFRVGAEDAEFLVKEFEPVFTEIDIVNLPKYQILLKLMINGVASDPFSAITLSPNPAFLTGNSEKTIKVSRERYSNPVVEVEEKISRWMGAEYHQEAAIVLGQEDEDNELADDEKPAEVKKVIQQDVVKLPPVIINPEPVKPRPTEQPDAKPLQHQPQIKKDVHIQKFEQHSYSQKNNQPQKNFLREGDRHNHSNQPPKHHGQHDKAHHQPQKKHNPIWDKVADLQQQKIKEANHRTSETVTQIFTPQSIPQTPQTIVPTQPQSPTPPTPSSERKILHPGQSQII